MPTDTQSVIAYEAMYQQGLERLKAEGKCGKKEIRMFGDNTMMPGNPMMKESGGIEGGILQSTNFGQVILEGIRNGTFNENELKQLFMGSDELPIKDSLLKEIDMVMKEIENNDKPEMAGDQKIGRNSPCPCGSGKKYKHCCGKLGSGK